MGFERWQIPLVRLVQEEVVAWIAEAVKPSINHRRRRRRLAALAMSGRHMMYSVLHSLQHGHVWTQGFCMDHTHRPPHSPDTLSAGVRMVVWPVALLEGFLLTVGCFSVVYQEVKAARHEERE